MSIEDDINFMERVPLLALLGRPALRVLAIGAETRQIGAGTVLFVAGEAADAGYLIQEGSFSLLPAGATSAEQEVIAGPGMLLGEMALMTETVRPVTATALAPAVVLRISRTLFLRMLDGYPEAARRLRDSLIQRTEQWTRELAAVRALLDRVAPRSQ
jgi:CRP-like cAMP-binding protein